MSNDQAAVPAPQGDIRPLVAKAASNRAVWIFGGVLGIATIGLFTALEARRSDLRSPAITSPTFSGGGIIAAPPELAIPADTQGLAYGGDQPPQFAPNALGQAPVMQAPMRPMAAQPSMPRTGAQTAPALPPALPGTLGPIPQSAAVQGPAFAYQAPPRRTGPGEAGTGTANETRRSDQRALASKLANPATTVPQGTVIQAVMETAFDSTRSGFARAVVSRDATSFDGSRVLIPRGSKLFGEYKADVAHGQNRAVIQWHRLTRPDGSIIDVDSPAADPLGRMGVKGKVNSHFFSRFGGAILQTALDVGFQLATRKATGDTVIVGLPGSMQNAANSIARPEDVKPTITLKQGAGVTVFVGRDLDFTPVEQ